MEVNLRTLFTPPLSSKVDVSFMVRQTGCPVTVLLYTWVQDCMEQLQYKSVSSVWPFILLKKIIFTNYLKKVKEQPEATIVPVTPSCNLCRVQGPAQEA